MSEKTKRPGCQKTIEVRTGWHAMTSRRCSNFARYDLSRGVPTKCKLHCAKVEALREEARHHRPEDGTP